MTEKEAGCLRSEGQGGLGEISASEVRPDMMKNARYNGTHILVLTLTRCVTLNR